MNGSDDNALILFRAHDKTYSMSTTMDTRSRRNFKQGTWEEMIAATKGETPKSPLCLYTGETPHPFVPVVIVLSSHSNSKTTVWGLEPFDEDMREWAATVMGRGRRMTCLKEMRLVLHRLVHPAGNPAPLAVADTGSMRAPTSQRKRPLNEVMRRLPSSGTLQHVEAHDDAGAANPTVAVPEPQTTERRIQRDNADATQTLPETNEVGAKRQQTRSISDTGRPEHRQTRATQDRPAQDDIPPNSPNPPNAPNPEHRQTRTTPEDRQQARRPNTDLRQTSEQRRATRQNVLMRKQLRTTPTRPRTGIVTRSAATLGDGDVRLGGPVPAAQAVITGNGEAPGTVANITDQINNILAPMVGQAINPSSGVVMVNPTFSFTFNMGA